MVLAAAPRRGQRPRGYNPAVAPDPPDQALVEQALGGDAEAFGALVERYYRMISVLALQKTGHRADAEDIVQETFVRAFRALPSLRDGEKFASWLYNIAFKLCIDWGRRRERRRQVLGDDALEQAESGRFRRDDGAIGREMETADEHRRVLEAMGQLPDKYRLIMTLRHVRKLSYKEIAVHLGEPTGTIANRLHRAMRMVQERLGAEQTRAEDSR